MAVTSVHVTTPPAGVWQVLSDGWLFPLWVVGTSRIRQVDAAWPEAGARLHHSVGLWPVLSDDHTEVLAVEPERRLELQARAWPLGEARVILTLEAVDAGTKVTIEEDLTVGPGALLPKPVRAASLHWRNTETLRRLKMLAEGRS
jgi:uncharacterized protein YndB with AHSA1/START domain